MDEVMPLEAIPHHFSTKILKLTLLHKSNSATFYQAATTFGDMTFLIEEFTNHSHFQPKEIISSNQKINLNNKSLYFAVQQRNQLIKQQNISTPLIYEQCLLQIRQDYFLSMMLMEPIQFHFVNQTNNEFNNMKDRQFMPFGQNLILSAYLMQELNEKYKISYASECFSLRQVISSLNNSNLYFDFTKIIYEDVPFKKQDFISNSNSSQNKNQTMIVTLKVFKQNFIKHLKITPNKKMQSILFMKDTPLAYNISAIKGCESWLDLCLLFNLLPQLLVKVAFMNNKYKTMPICKLTGKVTFEYNNKVYENYNFNEGNLMDGFNELTFEELHLRYFEPNVMYMIEKQKYICVYKRHLHEERILKEGLEKEGQSIEGKEGQWIEEKREAREDVLFVKPSINKVQFINFLIAYLRSIEPILNKIQFIHQENSLHFTFINKFNQTRTVLIKFPKQYIVKDQEMSIIIEKSRLDQAVILLARMHITDSFLMFLANCDKMNKIIHLDISYCSRVTENGINTMLISPFCRKLSVLKLCSIPVDISLLLMKLRKLNELDISYCTNVNSNRDTGMSERDSNSEAQPFQIIDIYVQKLYSLGFKISLNFNSKNLHYLYLDEAIPVENLKHLKGFALIELKIKLIESKTTITNLISNLYSSSKESNGIRVFAEGVSSKSLKFLDVSGSNIKIRDMKPMISMEALETLYLQGIEKDKFMDMFAFPGNILNISLQSSPIKKNTILELLSKSNILITLNLSGTEMNGEGIRELCKGKKYLNQLKIQQKQYNSCIFEKGNPIQNLTLELDKLLIPHINQHIFHQILNDHSRTNKMLKLECPQPKKTLLETIITRYYKFTKYAYNSKASSNITINDTKFDLHNSHFMARLLNPHDEFFRIANVNKVGKEQQIFMNSLLVRDSQSCCEVQESHFNTTAGTTPFTIERFNYCLHRVIQLHPTSIIDVSIKGNRLIPMQVIQMLHKYSSSSIRAIDFRGCLFSFEEVKDWIFQFPNLQSMNNGEYEIIFEQKSFNQSSQQYLKFFMRQSRRYEMKLRIKITKIMEVELAYSILYHILDLYCNNILQIYIQIEDSQICTEVLYFWECLLQKMKTLQVLQICFIRYFHIISISISEGIIRRSKVLASLKQLMNSIDDNLTFLHELSLKVPSEILPDQMTLGKINTIRIDLNYIFRSNITEHHLNKLFRNCHGQFQSIQLLLASCEQITSLSKFIGMFLDRQTMLVEFELDISSCKIRWSQILELMGVLQKCNSLSKLTLNISWCLSPNDGGWLELIQSIDNFHKSNLYCPITIIALGGVKSYAEMIASQKFLENGVQLIL